MPSIFNIPNQYNGDTFEEVRFNMYVNSVSDSTRKSLLDATPRIQIKNKKDLSTVVDTWTIDNSKLEWISEENGQFKIAISDPIDYGAGTYVYDLQITYTNVNPAKVKTYLKGEFKVLNEITT